MKKIYLGADHAGFQLKEKLKKYLTNKVKYEDLGAFKFDKTDDYPDYAVKVAHQVAKEKNSLGILVCGSAQGMSMTANKIKGIRAVVPFSVKEAQLSRLHDNANVLCLSGWFISFATAKEYVQQFLKTKFSGESKRVRRLKKIARLEK